MKIEYEISKEFIENLKSKIESGKLGITYGGGEYFGFGEDLEELEQKIIVKLLENEIDSRE